MPQINGLTYSQYLYSITDSQVRQMFLDLGTAVTDGRISPAEFAGQVEQLSGKTVQIHRAANGDILGYTLNNRSTLSTPNPINSNANTINRGTVSMPVSTGIDGTTQKATAARLTGLGTKVATGAALVGTAAMCVGTGITLGKTIDSALYNLNPNFWDSNNMSSLNPETWGAITSGQEGLGADLINVLFGFDPETGEGQAYIDERALAYFAAYMQSQGVFANGSGWVIDSDTAQELNINPFEFQKLPLYGNSFAYTSEFPYESDMVMYIISQSFGAAPILDATVKLLSKLYVNFAMLPCYDTTQRRLLFASDTYIPDDDSVRTGVVGTRMDKPYIGWRGPASFVRSYTHNGDTVYFNFLNLSESTIVGYPDSFMYLPDDYGPYAWAMIYGNSTEQRPIEGIGSQQGATTPQDLSTNPAETLQQLQTQYPDLWSNALQYPVIQPDGTVKNYTYVPVALPDFSTRTDTQPTSDTATQQQTQILPDVYPKELIDTITQVLQQPSSETGQDVPPDNPTDTGDGSSPTLVPPTGTASALWSIYHPTQAEIDSFGAWLWSPSFIDQIAKIFNNPMESIIGLHKIYATPVDAGTSTIVVGYLDSQVSSAYITQQYVDVDCGSVNLSEQFGNVFDYAPFTSVKLYLPFIGIVSLDVSEVMRSTISISYGVDVLTGACLARVNVVRDSNNSILYQFAGNCAVQYPLSMGSYMGIVSSILSVAGSAVATFASGGSLAPLAIGAASAAFGAHTSVQNSGSFSGNSGAMGGKKPYLIIERPQTRMANEQESYIGTPTNYNSTVGDYSGFVRALSVHLEGVKATDTELGMIQTLLEGGILA